MKFRWPWTAGRKKPQAQAEAGAAPRKRKPKRPVLEMMAIRTEKLKIRTEYLRALARFEEYKRHVDEAKRGESDKDDLHIELGDLRRIDKMLRPLGMKIMTEKGGDALEDENGFSSVLKTIAQNVGAGAAAMLMQKQAAAAQQPPLYTQPQLPPASVATITAPVAEAPAAEPEQLTVPQEAGNMTWIAQAIQGSLENKDPEAAARWILGQKRDEARQLVRVACAITDEQVPAALAQFEQQYPDLALLVQWLRSRPEWTLQTIRALRTLAATTERKIATMGL
ncbi:MAG: hypothetical protein ACYC4L_11475 [Chloroflexota bacterium]